MGGGGLWGNMTQVGLCCTVTHSPEPREGNTGCLVA